MQLGGDGIDRAAHCLACFVGLVGGVVQAAALDVGSVWQAVFGAKDFPLLAGVLRGVLIVVRHGVFFRWFAWGEKKARPSRY